MPTVALHLATKDYQPPVYKAFKVTPRSCWTQAQFAVKYENDVVRGLPRNLKWQANGVKHDVNDPKSKHFAQHYL